MAQRITDSAFASRPKAGRRVVERWGAAGANGDSCTGAAADGPKGAARCRPEPPWAFRPKPPGRSESVTWRADWKRAIYDAPRPGQKPLLDDEHGQRIIAMVCGPPPAGRARWTVRLIAAGGGEAQTGRAGRSGDGSHPASEPRSEAVAGKKCGAWRSWMRSISGAWKTFWRYTKSRSRRRSRWSASMKSRWCCTRISALRCPHGREGWRGGTTSTSAVARPTSFAAWSRRRGGIFSSPRPTARRREFADYLVEIVARYPEARTIHLVMDNLNTHGRKSLTRTLRGEAGRITVGAFHRSLHAQARQLAQSSRDRSEPAQPLVPGTTQNSGPGRTAQRSSRLWPASKPQPHHHRMEFHSQKGSAETPLLITKTRY